MGREPKLLVAVGKKGCGKSFTTEKMLRQYATGNPAKGVPPRKVLIIDVNDEYYQYKAIRVSDVILFSAHPLIEIRRIRPFLDNGKKMTLDDIANSLLICLDTFKNGLMLIEDVNKYIADTMPNDLIGAICTNRHIGVDIILHYQSIGRITSKVWQNLNIIRMHKFTDTVKKHKHKYEDKWEYLSIAECMINQKIEAGDNRFFVYADVDTEKIYGNFDEDEMDSAVNLFIQQEYNHLVKPMLNARNEYGKKIHTPYTALHDTKARLMKYKL